MSAKLLSPKLFDDGCGILWHWCPGCNSRHGITIELQDGLTGPIWSWDGNVLAPTFSPSIHIYTDLPIWHFPGHGHSSEYLERKRLDPNYKIPYQRKTLCHYFLKDGILDLLGDCAHDLKGTKVPLPDLPEAYQLTR